MAFEAEALDAASRTTFKALPSCGFSTQQSAQQKDIFGSAHSRVLKRGTATASAI